VSVKVATLNDFGSDSWNAEVYGSLSVASRISSMVKTKTQIIQLAYLLHSLNGRLKSLFNDIQEKIDNPSNFEPPAEPATPEQFKKAIDTLRELSTTLFNIYERSKRARLTNNSLIAGSLSRLHTYSEDLCELADWLEMIQKPEAIEAIFDRAKQETERGEVFDLSRVE